jgi:hypothetical protein
MRVIRGRNDEGQSTSGLAFLVPVRAAQGVVLWTGSYEVEYSIGLCGLQVPFVGRAGDLLGVGEVDFGEAGVAAHHFEGGVAEEVLEGGHVAAVAEEVDGEGVAEAVRGGADDAGALAEAGDEFLDGGAFEGLVGAAGGDEGGGGGGGWAVGEVAPEGFAGGLADVDDAGFVAFAMLDEEAAGFAVVVAELEGAEFGDAEAGIEEDDEDGDVAVLGGAPTFAHAVVAAVVDFHAGGGGDEAPHFVFGVGLHGVGVGAGADDVAQDVGDAKLGGGPRPECGQGDPGVEDGFGGEVEVVVEVGEEGVDLGGFDGFDFGVFDPDAEAAEGEVVVEDGGFAEAAAPCEPVAVECVFPVHGAPFVPCGLTVGFR